MIEDEELLMAVLNSAPVVDGVPTDQLEDSRGSELTGRFGGTCAPEEFLSLRRTRDALQGMIREDGDAVGRLADVAGAIALSPEVSQGGIRWRLETPDVERLAARAVVAWSRVVTEMPGRLRACANTECNLFLIDHSRPGTAKWCSMATCGNRMKARAYTRRARRA